MLSECLTQAPAKRSLLLMGAVFALSALGSPSALAYAPEGDLLKVKGYSPEVIQLTGTQRSRQEWREPSAPTNTPVERFFHNIYYGEWTEGVDAFGSHVIREN